MSRIWVSNDTGDLMAEIAQGDDGYASGSCAMGDWATDPERRDSLHDVIEEAGIHVDLRH